MGDNNTSKWAALGAAVVALFAFGAVRWRILKRQRVRIDPAGDGRFGADRGDHRHMGLDLVASPGEAVFAPFSGLFVGSGYAYPHDPRLHALRIKGERHTAEFIYVAPRVDLMPGTHVTAGDVIGTAEDVRVHYPGADMLPHVHLEVMDPEGKFINPARFLALDA